MNRFSYSEQFDNAAWPTIGSLVTANVTTGPFGGAVADKLVLASGEVSGRVLQNATDRGDYTTFSVYAKAAELSELGLQMRRDSSSYPLARFDLSSGEVINADGFNATIVDVGDGWFRCGISGPTNGVATSFMGIWTYTDTTGDDVSGIYLYGAQYETSLSPTEYQKKTNTLAEGGNHASQATASNRRSYRTDGTLHWLQDDLTDDALNSRS